MPSRSFRKLKLEALGIESGNENHKSSLTERTPSASCVKIHFHILNFDQYFGPNEPNKPSVVCAFGQILLILSSGDHFLSVIVFLRVITLYDRL